LKFTPSLSKQPNQNNGQSDHVDSYIAASLMTEIIRTHAEQLAQDAEERLRQRQRELAEQSSTANPPDVRIRAWEKVHALRMPGDAAHPVLEVIARGTGLALEQIHEEQRARLALRTKRSAGQHSSEPAKSKTSNSEGDTLIP
jgi:2-polyprenyl-6-methoxyphenol hydroxylase-like FAD-dependent oxidoreductase